MDKLIAVTLKAYQSFLLFMYGGKANTVVGIEARYCNILLSGITLYVLLCCLLKRKKFLLNNIVLIIGIAIYPGIALLMNILMGKNSISFYVSYALFLVYPVIILVVSKSEIAIKHLKTYKVVHCLFFLCIFLLLFINIRYSNSAYTKQKILYDRTVSNMTRVLCDIEKEPEYIRGETPVIILGRFGSNSNLKDIASEHALLQGFERLSITYTMTMGSFANLLGDTIVIENDEDVLEEYSELEEVQKMPMYPERGYYKMIEGRMVIKVS